MKIYSLILYIFLLSCSSNTNNVVDFLNEHEVVNRIKINDTIILPLDNESILIINHGKIDTLFKIWDIDRKLDCVNCNFHLCNGKLLFTQLCNQCHRKSNQNLYLVNRFRNDSISLENVFNYKFQTIITRLTSGKTIFLGKKYYFKKNVHDSYWMLNHVDKINLFKFLISKDTNSLADCEIVY